MLHIFCGLPPGSTTSSSCWEGRVIGDLHQSCCIFLVSACDGLEWGNHKEFGFFLGKSVHPQDEIPWYIMKLHELIPLTSPDIGNGQYFLPLWCLNIWCYILLWLPTRTFHRLQLLRRPCDRGSSPVMIHFLGVSMWWSVVRELKFVDICQNLGKSWEVITIDKIWQDEISWNIMKSYEIASFDSPYIGNGKYFLPLWCLNIWCYLFLWPPTRRYDRLQLLRRPCDLGISSISSHHLTFSQIGNGWYFHVFPAFLMP